MAYLEPWTGAILGEFSGFFLEEEEGVNELRTGELRTVEPLGV